MRCSSARSATSAAGADALLRQLAFELGDAGLQRRHHAPVRGGEVECHPVQRYQRHVPGFQFFERRQQVRRATPPARQLRHQHRVDLAPLRQGQHLAALRPVKLHPGRGFLVGADHLVAGALCERGEVALLARAGLVRRGHPAVERGALWQRWPLLSQLNSPCQAACKPLFLHGPGS